ADDMGYSDLGCFGGEIDTPHLDALAADGLRFTRFANTGRCCPSRASILTGMYPHRVGIGHMSGDYGVPGYRGFLRADVPTVAERLGPAGYRTIAVGKWHVGGRRPHWPTDRGFDRGFGPTNGGGFYYPESMRRRKQTIVDGLEPATLPDDWYVTDLFTDRAIGFVEEAVDDDEPFFLYLAHIAPHWPLQAPEEVIEKYLDRYADGWPATRARRFAKQQEIGLATEAWRLSPRHRPGQAWDGLAPAKRAEMTRRMATHAAMVDVLDRNVGRLVTRLKELGRFENTLFLFLSDNGASPESADGWKLGTPGAAIGSPESYTSFRAMWANAANTPFRKFKAFTHEGGVASPLIAHWPAGGISGGGFCREPAHIVDLVPTVLDAAGLPDTAGEFDGRSLRPAFDSGPIARPNLGGRLFWEHQGCRAVLDGDWKLVAGHRGRWELYDLSSDRCETEDLASRHPRRVEELAAAYDAWAEDAGVLPWPAKEAAKRLSQKTDAADRE
ncbi:MAG: arylsulfatase, partial [Planctomycetota bacterium]